MVNRLYLQYNYDSSNLSFSKKESSFFILFCFFIILFILINIKQIKRRVDPLERPLLRFNRFIKFLPTDPKREYPNWLWSLLWE